MGQVNLAATGETSPARPIAPPKPRDPKLWKAAGDFQEVMLSQFTQSMRTTEKDSALCEECPGREAFDGMFSDALAHQMSQSGALGLNKMIYRAMGGTYEKKPASAPATAHDAAAPAKLRTYLTSIHIEKAE